MRFSVKYTITADGAVLHEISGTVREDAPFLPRFGAEYLLTAGSESISYYGMGSGENYADLCAHTKMGWYNTAVSDEYVPYVRPQEHGNHTKVYCVGQSASESSRSNADGKSHFISNAGTHYRNI